MKRECGKGEDSGLPNETNMHCMRGKGGITPTARFLLQINEL